MRTHCLILAAAGALAFSPTAPACANPTPRIGLTSDAHLANDEGLVPEGSFVVRQFGRMRRLVGGGWAFVFAPDANGRSLPPMIMLPCGALQAMEQIVGPSGRSAGFVVSGQVFVYEGRNYLLPTLYAQATEPPDDQPVAEAIDSGAEPPPTRPHAGDTLRGVPEPSVEELIQRIEEATSRSAPAQAAPQKAPDESGLLSEGMMIAQRRVRLVRSDQGGWRVVFDNSAASMHEADAPLELMACQLVETMRRHSERGGDPVFVVSGRVFIYAGRNYLMPTMVVMDRARNTGITAAQ